MKNIRRIFIVALIMISGGCFASTYSLSQGIQKVMQSTLGSRLDSVHVGVVVRSMSTGQYLYEKNPNHLFAPASVLKLLTATAALDFLKPTFRFSTQLLAQGTVNNHVLKGDLFLKFGGDPQLKSSDLQNLVHQLHQQGIQKITGHVYIDASDYSNVPYPPGWIWDDLSYSYAAPVTSIIINHNCFGLTLKPQGGSQHPAVVTNLPAGVVRFSNNLVIIKNPHQNCPIRLYSNDENHYTLEGCYYYRWKQQVRKVAIRRMSEYAKVLFHNELKENQISYQGPIELRARTSGARVIAEHLSLPLADIIKKMLKDSDNLITNAIFKKLGETYFHTEGTWQNGLHALKNILTKRAGIDFKKNLVNDGPGLSRYNLISPEQLSKVLYFAYHNPTVREALVSALPIGGRDGTLRYRLSEQGKEGRVRMKTGTMTGVTALAGYIRTEHLGDVSAVIMVNGFVKPKRPYTLLEDNICRYLIRTSK